MKRIVSLLLVVFVAFSLIGCAKDETAKQDIGTVTGGVIGGLIGSQFGQGSGQVVAAAGGAVAGALIGGAIGKNMDKTDKMQMQQSLETQKTGQTTRWKNPDTGNSYAVTPTKTYQQGNTYCREYVSRATINGEETQVYGTACRQPDGSWKVVK